jgi:DNA-binding winged helix-turn-helix (wHTH) protein/tetratricopeptide (TPR) repeat protein
MRYAFADFVLDPECYRLTRAGADVRVEPRVLELLALLVAERHRVVTKEELVSRLWAAAFVGDSVLSRAVYEARRAVGDDSTGQRFIKTVHGRGYQFVAPVEEAGKAVVAAPRDEEGGEAAEPTPRDDGTTDRAAGNAPLEPSAPAAPATLSHVSRRRRPVLWAGVALVAAIAATAGTLLSTSRSRTPAAGGETAGHGMARLAVVPVVAADNDDAELALVALSVTDLLGTRLQVLPGLIVRSPEYAAALSRTSPSLAEFAADAEVGLLLTGTVRRLRDVPRAQLAVELHIVGADGALDSLPLGSYELPLLASGADLHEFLRVRETVARRIESLLAPAVGVQRGAPAPHDAEAYRLYLLARQRLETLGCGEAPAIEDLLSRSLRLDPQFALAWMAQGFVLYSQTWACGREAAYAERALAAADEALAIDADLSEAIYLKVLLLTETGRAEEAYALAQAAHTRQPRAPLLLLGQSYALRYAGFLSRSAQALDQALALDPLVVSEWREPPLTLVYQGRYDEFLKHLGGDTGSYELLHRGWIELVRGNRAAALRSLESAFEQNPADLFGRYGSALTAWLSGDVESGRAILRGIVQQRDALGTPDGEMTYREAQLLGAFGEPAAALARLDRAVAQGFFCPPCLEAAPFLATLRSEPGFDAVVARASRRHQEFGDRFQLHGHTVSTVP